MKTIGKDRKYNENERKQFTDDLSTGNLDFRFNYRSYRKKLNGKVVGNRKIYITFVFTLFYITSIPFHVKN